MIDQQWLTILIILLIVVIIVDGVRRMRKAKKDSIKMSLRKHFDDDDDDDVIYGSEFPNGGARSSEAEIDKDRIMEARSRYNFGDDLPVWNKQQKTMTTATDDDIREPVASTQEERVDDKIEPSFSQVDELSDSDIESDYITEPDAVVLPDMPTKVPPSPVIASKEPVQTSLNLDDDVPMLMEEIEPETILESASVKEPEFVENEVVPAQALEKPIQNIAAKIEPPRPEVDTHSANKPRFESKYTHHADQRGRTPQDVIVINLRARGDAFLGSDLLPVILDNGLRFGAMDIFHYHAEEDGEGDVLFSMANIVKPGTFDLAQFEIFETVGLSFFLTLPVSVGSHMQAFEQMIGVVQSMAKALDAELLDENRNVLTRQSIEHYRERVRNFSHQEQLEKNK